MRGSIITPRQPDGKIVIAGNFTRVGATVGNRVARLNPDGTVDLSFNPGTGANAEVTDIAIQQDGKILICGGFTSVNGQPRNWIARLLPNGSVEGTDTFNPGTGPNGTVIAVAVQNDGRILLGGYFTSVNGQTRNRIARLNADGTLDSTGIFTSSGGTNGGVFSFAFQSDGKILFGGNFSQVNGQPHNRIARLFANGDLEGTSTFTASLAVGNGPSTIAVQPDGRILISGAFDTLNGLHQGGIARLNANGTVESTATFNPGTGTSPFGNVESSLQPDGKIVLGGPAHRRSRRGPD